MAWIGAVAGAIGSYYSAQAANQPRTTSGEVNMNTERTPGLGSDIYRAAAQRRAYELMGGGYTAGQSADSNRFGRAVAPSPNGILTGYQGTGAPGGAPGTGGGGGGRRGGGGGAGGGGPISSGTQAAINALGSRATAGSPYYKPAQDATTGILTGNDPNAYRAETFDRLSTLSDPDLERFKQMLFAGETPGSGGAGGYGSFAGGGGGGQPAQMPVGAAAYIKEILGGKYLDQGNPYTQQLVDNTNADISKAYTNTVVPGVNNTFTGAGRYGSGAYAKAQADASGQFTKELGAADSTLRANDWNSRMQDVMQALGYGTSLDQNAADNATSRANAASAAGASAYGSSQQASVAKMQTLLQAIGQGEDLSKFGLSGMAGLSSDYSKDYISALGLTPELSGMDIRDLSAWSGAGLNADQIRQADAASRRSTGVQRADLNFRQQQYYHDLPMGDLARYMDIINAASGGYGNEHQYGTNQSSGPGAGVSPWGQALAGGIGGYYAARNYNSGTGTGGG